MIAAGASWVVWGAASGTWSALPRRFQLIYRSADAPQKMPVDYAAFNRFCRSLPATTHVVQWGGSHVWKVGGKVFAIGGWAEDEPAFTFKTDDLDLFEMLGALPGVRPAPYFASRGMTWLQHYASPGLSDAQLKHHLRESHRIVSRGLTRKRRRELGLGSD
jgi:predicted DNA-binding protein (MmcQ/YjbR family)